MPVNTIYSHNSSEVAAALKAAGDSMRLGILNIMRRDSFGVLELCQIFDVQQPSMSHHLKVMVKAGLLGSRREGNSIFYRRVQNARPEKQGILNQIYAISDASNLANLISEKVQQVQQARKKKSQEFFQENLHRFREQQDLIASFSDYGDAVQDLFNSGVARTWLEVGAGEGDLVDAAHTRFEQTIALDISEDLLDRCRQRVAQPNELGGANEPSESDVTFFLGDTAEAIEKGVRADCISCNMVLHHVPSPATVIREMAQILNSGGQILLCDLDEHDQEWARSSCGDLWLGFSADEISQWAMESGLKEARAQFLALRNGFRIQIREFIKE